MSPREISFGLSPCPNDTFAFYAALHGLVDTHGWNLRPHMADVEELNRLALAGELEMTKLSFTALGRCLDRYGLLSAGAALGRGCGPLVVCRPGFDLERLGSVTVAVPGFNTTAFMLLSLYLGHEPQAQALVFDQIMPAVAAGEFEAGLIIHEGRFTFAGHGLEAPVDLGAWWEQDSGLPIPLGCIAVRRDLGAPAARELQDILAASVAHAQAEPRASQEFVLAHAQEMKQAVVSRHIGLYVNAFSRDLGDEGLAAVEELLARGREIGLLPEAAHGLLGG
ncbi:MAG: 1,4-dihydroxy-6-naphthoate synthase [Desulfarculaceae bacterium]|nr:1,4-dihydroxy-6-naphthoate synthase [Desulfarculaceae bacterium]MCF8047708.1 1,4-dihydroxy-6-naphthoate synthase [Desulfarculaceae bacterium]MCF8065706.1 1,4-dihydroxy-6-naphthoate synthase [Desulfarculaceae bacterium]MCF8096904.1 1,4-dihydroxy-6-naphthoate synthase [Desulfarculaceae bacterium]MCF8120883.1 1,4-dihydroxy-6-naphthoate synthase [Desulfarculaceae bacterium]